AQGPLRGGEKIDAVEGEPARRDLARRRRQPENGAAGLRLAGARFADDAEPLAAKMEGDAAPRLDDAGLEGKADRQILDGEELVSHRHARASSRGLRVE